MTGETFADLVDGYDVGMSQAGRRAGFGQEALESHRFLKKIGEKHLKRYHSVEADLPGLVDHAHPAAADFLQDGKVVDRLADQRGSVDPAGFEAAFCGSRDQLKGRQFFYRRWRHRRIERRRFVNSLRTILRWKGRNIGRSRRRLGHRPILFQHFRSLEDFRNLAESLVTSKQLPILS